MVTVTTVPPAAYVLAAETVYYGIHSVTTLAWRPRAPEYGSLDHHGHPLCPPTSWFAEHDVPREIAAPVAALARTARRPLVLHRNSGDRRARQAGALLASRRFA